MTDDGAPTPAWAASPITLVPHDPEWSALAGRLVARVRPLVAAAVTGPIEHVGSTAVPGLAAKPTIDLAASVTSVTAADAVADGLVEDGWAPIPQEPAHRSWHRAWVLPDGGRRLAHLHLVAVDHPRCGEMERFRDALHADDDLRASYERLKRLLADRHRGDREGYAEAKTAFVREALLGARRRG